MSLRIGIACGGTGGHVFPGRITGETLRGRGHKVTLWLGGKNIESTSAAGWTGDAVTVPSEGFPSHFSLDSFRIAWRLLAATRRCLGLMRRRRPDVLLAMGSYASVAPVLAARMLRVPIALHESNVIPGRAAGFLARFASAVAVAFPETRGRWHHPHIVWTGLPVRTPTGRCFPGAALSPGVFTVLFMGGSQGAHRLNELATEALRALHREGLPFQVVHLAGFEDRDPVERRYQEAGIRHLVFDFLADIEQAYRAADLAVCRAGAATCGELAAFGVPALLVPYPAAISGHQLENAKAMEAGGAADVVEQRDLTSARLAEYIRHAQRHPEKREAMKNALKSRAALDAADRLATLVEDVARSRHQGCGQRPS